MKRLIVSLLLLSVVRLCWADTTYPDPIVVGEGETKTIDVPSGEVHIYSGVISGAGSVKKTGLGRLVLSGANTYAGGFDLARGKVEARTSTAFGTGTVVLSAPAPSDSWANGPAFVFAAPNATFENDFNLTGGGALGHDDFMTFFFNANTTLNGKITTVSDYFRFTGENSLTDAQRNALVVHLKGKIANS